jgi:hypothetical protein
MHRVLSLLLTIVIAAPSFAQRERVYLDMNKYSCVAGDTVFFKAYVFKGFYPSRSSSNLYINVFSESGQTINQSVFPIFEGQGIGQIIFPDSLETNNYFIVGYTRQELNFDTIKLFSIPIYIYNKEKFNTVHHKIYLEEPLFNAQSVNGIFWATTIYSGPFSHYHQNLSSYLSIDSPETGKNLHLIKLQNGDSILKLDVKLNDTLKQKYTLFPIDTSRENECLLLFQDSILIARQIFHFKEKVRPIAFYSDTLDVAKGGFNSWEVKFPDSTIYYSSVTVSDADRTESPPINIENIKESYAEDFTLPVKHLDNSFISLTGKIYDSRGKSIRKIADKGLFVAGIKDSTFIFNKLLSIDSLGRFALDSLVFFDSIDLHFHVNGANTSNVDNMKLEISLPVIPHLEFTPSFASNWIDNVSKETDDVDSYIKRKDKAIVEYRNIKTLEKVEVKGRKNVLSALNRKYTTGVFSEATPYTYDLDSGRNQYYLKDFLQTNFPEIEFDPATDFPRFKGKPIIFYFDEQLVTWETISSININPGDNNKLIKVFRNQQWFGTTPFLQWAQAGEEELNKPVSYMKPKDEDKKPKLKGADATDPLVVCVYSRKPDDYRSIPGGLNRMSIKGFTKIISFKPDDVTAYWNPFISGNSFRIRFYNYSAIKRFRLKIAGMSYNGRIVHFEAIIK